MQAVKTPLAVQQRLLEEILFANQESCFGRKYRFNTIRTYQEFTKQVPIQTYENFAPYIQRIAAGETEILTTESVIAFEMTGGSTQGAKLIPYTASGLAAFRQAIFPWMADLLHYRPRILTGRTYWAISPVTRPFTTTSGGISIGMSSDAAYFGEDVEAWITKLLAVSCGDGFDYRYCRVAISDGVGFAFGRRFKFDFRMESHFFVAVGRRDTAAI